MQKMFQVSCIESHLSMFLMHNINRNLSCLLNWVTFLSTICRETAWNLFCILDFLPTILQETLSWGTLLPPLKPFLSTALRSPSYYHTRNLEPFLLWWTFHQTVLDITVHGSQEYLEIVELHILYCALKPASLLLRILRHCTVHIFQKWTIQQYKLTYLAQQGPCIIIIHLSHSTFPKCSPL